MDEGLCTFSAFCLSVNMNGSCANDITQYAPKKGKESSIKVPSLDATDGSNAEKEFMRIATIDSEEEHCHKIKKCMNLKSSHPENLLLPEDQIIEVQGESTSSLSHEDLIASFNQHVCSLYSEKTVITVKIWRQTNGLKEIVTFKIGIEVSQLEEDGDICESVITTLSCTTVKYPYDDKITRTVRLGTPLGKYLKQNKKTSELALLVEPIDDDKSTKYNFECVEYLVGPLNDSQFQYLCCFRVKEEDSWFYVCQNRNGGLQLSKMEEIDDDNFEVTCDRRFCFRSESGDDSFFRKRISNHYFLAFNTVDKLHFRQTKLLPWTEEAMRIGKSDEFRFRMININSDSYT